MKNIQYQTASIILCLTAAACGDSEGRLFDEADDTKIGAEANNEEENGDETSGESVASSGDAGAQLHSVAADAGGEQGSGISEECSGEECAESDNPTLALPAGKQTLLIAEGVYDGVAVRFDCQGPTDEFPKLQSFFKNAGLALYQIRCRTEDDTMQLWLDQAGHDVQSYDYPLSQPVDGGVGFGSPSDITPLNQYASSKTLNRITVTKFVPDELIEGTFEAAWDGEDRTAVVNGVFRVAAK